MEKKSKYLPLIYIFVIIIIAILGTYAWLNYRTNNTAMVLTAGDIETMHITVETYQINENIAPVLTYDSGVEADVTMSNSSISPNKGKLYYQINRIDQDLVSSDFKWTIEKSTDNGTNYTYYREGNFSTASVGEDLVILEETVPAGNTYKYKVYIWLDGSSSQQQAGSTFNGELRAEIEQQYLYDVLKKAASVGTYASIYTGSHQDSMDPSKSDKTIYYWYGSSHSTGSSIQNMNNVIFADHCWQMIRTTDTGGVRLIYNGEAENNQCLNTRSMHVGYYGETTISLSSGSYYYGTSYNYDKANNVFSLAGTTEQSAWNETTASNLVGKYTCRATTASATCASLYLVESYSDRYQGYVITINTGASYSQIGTLPYNTNDDSPAYVGYMYNTIYPVTSKYNQYSIQNGGTNINTNWYYSASIDYGNLNANMYTLINPEQISTLADTNDLIGKYVLPISSASYTQAYYVLKVSGNTMYYRSLMSGDLATSLMMSDGYEDNHNGTYTLTSATQITYVDWYNSTDATRDTYKSKYICLGTSATCSNLIHIANQKPGQGFFTYFSTASSNYKYSTSVSYSSGSYTLTGDIQTIWDIPDSTELAKISNHHYTCLSQDTTCSSVKYIYYYVPPKLYYIELSDVGNIADALTKMLTSASVNIKNSTMKMGIDAWYEKYLYNTYDTYIDDTIYCNDRRIRSLGAWNSTGGSITSDADNLLQFQEYTSGNDLSCYNITDKFSISNSSASLTYKVGLLSNPEINLLNNANARKTGQYYWLLSPYYFASNIAYVREVSSNGSIGCEYLRIPAGVRPAISLIPGISYTGGNGSMETPYIVDAPALIGS